MRRKQMIPQFITVMVFLVLVGLLHQDENLPPTTREVYEEHLISLFKDLTESHKKDIKQKEIDGKSGQKEVDGKFWRKKVDTKDVKKEGDAEFGRKEVESGHKADGPEYAGFRDFIMTMNPQTRRVPEKAWLKAAQHVEANRDLGKYKSASLFEWEQIPSNTGGRTRAIMYDPNDPDFSKVWAGSVTGGLWFREDIQGEDTWHPVDDFWPSLAISCMTYDPIDTETFYVGTGEGQTAVFIYRESSGRGSGIWKSSNAGTDWKLLASTEGFEYVTDIAVRQENGKSVVYAGVSSGFYKEKIHTSKPEDGLYRSEDGGESWTQVLPEIPGEGMPFSPAHIEITSGNRLLVGTMRNVFQKGGGRILVSDNGKDWTVQDYFVAEIEKRDNYNIPGRVILASAPSYANRIYAILAGGDADPNNGFTYSQGVILIKSIDAGATWQKVNMPLQSPYSTSNWSFLAWHALTAAVHPNNPDVIWIGGLDLYRSDDGGWAWDQKSLWWNFGVWHSTDVPIYVHADQHSLIYRPGSKTELLNSNDGGVFIASNSQQPAPEFLEKNHGYNTLQYYSCVIHPEAGKRYFLGGCQDNGTFRTTDEPTSKNVSVSYGDGAICFIDEDEPNIQISGSQFNFYYYSTDGNHEKTYAYNFPGGTFINPVDYDDRDNILYSNGMTFEGAYQDNIIRIRQVNDTLLDAESVPAMTGSKVPFSAIHVVPGQAHGKTVVLAGSQSGRLFKLDNAQAVISATEIGSPEFPEGYISCVQNGSSAEQILVTFSNYGVKHVWQTTDYGTTWKDKTGNLPDMPVRWAIYPPGAPGTVMLATELGIWYTMDISAEPVNWIQAGEDFPNVRVDMLSARTSDNHILAATHGRGLFLSSGPLQLSRPSYSSPEGQLKIYPNPAVEYINVEIRSKNSGDWQLGIYSASGKLIRKENIPDASNEFTHRISVGGLEPGAYVLHAESGKQHFSHTFIKKR